jgi:N,N'-diacetylchitobiose transport system permease protein
MTVTAPADASAAAPSRQGAAAPPRRRFSALPYVLVAPTLLILGAVVGFPLVRLGIISTQKYGLRAIFTGHADPAGLSNYTAVLHDPQLAPVLVRTVVFAGTLVAGTILIGLLVAHALHAVGKRMRAAMMICLLGAWAMPSVASTMVWNWLFSPTYGVVNWLITQVGIFGDYTDHIWVARPLSGFFVVWLLVVWMSVPFVAVTLYAGLSQIPKEYHEAAAIDGASWWRRFRAVTVPYLRPVLLLVTVMSVIWDYNVFNQIWLITQGGPEGGTTTLPVWAFTKAFASQSYGQGAAIAVFSVLLLAVLAGWWVRRLVVTGEEG